MLVGAVMKEHIYFFDLHANEKYVRIGFDGSERVASHLSMGQRFLAAMPGSKDYEKRLHDHFAATLGLAIDGSRSIYEGQAVWDYVMWLVGRGFATTDPASVEHLPRVPWDAIRPENVTPFWNDGSQMALLPMPRSERLATVAKAAYHQSLSDEWYTPSKIVEAARRVLGTIDLDPASCPKANETIRATHFYSRQVDGLAEPHVWTGRVSINPPYGGLAQRFVEKLFRELDAGRTIEAIALFNANSMSSQWFDTVYTRADSLMVTRGRLEFQPGDPTQAFSSPTTGSVIAYFGPRTDRFADEFRVHGNILIPERARPRLALVRGS